MRRAVFLQILRHGAGGLYGAYWLADLRWERKRTYYYEC